jgi:hypothetical protein
MTFFGDAIEILSKAKRVAKIQKGKNTMPKGLFPD